MKPTPLDLEVRRQHLETKTAECQQAASDPGVDVSLIEESLTKTVWERMLANDDALRLADLLQSAVLKNRAKP